METYLVGGAVRDKLLGIPVKDRDWVVVGASPAAMQSDGFQQVGKGFPVFIHPRSGEEYALARTERKIAPGHTGFDFDASDKVTLQEDLERRDLTINAMAESAAGEIIDPFGGQRDIEQRLLRHVSDAFSEDPLRVLRVARFAARFAHLGFRVADQTRDLMRAMVASGELDTLVAERVWQELVLALATPDPARFIEVMRDCGALAVILPEVDRLFGIPQPEKYHPEIDTGVHILMCLQQAALLSQDPVVRFATLVHDVGKGVTDPARWPSHYGHESLGLDLVADIAGRLRIPREFQQLAALVCEHHTKLHRIQQLKPKTLLALLEALDAVRRPERLQKFIDACEADARGRTGLEDRPYPQRRFLETVLAAVQSVDVRALLAANPGADAESLIRQRRLEVITDALPALANHD